MDDYARIARVLRHLERTHEEQPSLAELARVAGLSPFHFHRLFSRWAGTTPKAFLKALTAAHAKRLLAGSRGVLEASLDAGLSGPGRLHDLLVSTDAVSPGEFKARGAGLSLTYGFHPSPFGPCLLALSPRGLCHLEFLEDNGQGPALKSLKAAWPRARFRQGQGATAKAARAVFARRRKSPLKVLLCGTPFQLKVWLALLRIPPGRTSSYRALAAGLGMPRAARAVGSAIGRNGVAYLIPCHRVIRETGVLGGYRWGPGRKRALLAWESCRKSPGNEKA